MRLRRDKVIILYSTPGKIIAEMFLNISVSKYPAGRPAAARKKVLQKTIVFVTLTFLFGQLFI